MAEIVVFSAFQNALKRQNRTKFENIFVISYQEDARINTSDRDKHQSTDENIRGITNLED